VRQAESTGANWIIRLLYYAGVPYMAVMLGAADFPAHLGLARLDWPASVGRGAILGIAVFAALAGIAWYSVRSLRQMGSVTPAPPHARPAWMAALDAFLLEAHWAFYRLPGILMTGDLLLGTAIGAGLAILERAADPRWRRAASSQVWLETWLDLALLVGMAVAFYFTRNFFVLWAIHAALDAGIRKMTQWLLERA
jgi:hypothetical protein